MCVQIQEENQKIYIAKATRESQVIGVQLHSRRINRYWTGFLRSEQPVTRTVQLLSLLCKHSLLSKHQYKYWHYPVCLCYLFACICL